MNMYQRGGIWHSGFRVDGKLVQRSLKTPDRKQAEKIEAHLRLLYLAGARETAQKFEMAVSMPLTVREAFERFKAERPNMVSNDMTKRDGISINNLVPFFGGFMLDEVNSAMISKYKQIRYAQKVSGATINREISGLSVMFNMAVREWGVAKSNPCQGIRKEKETPRDRYLSHEEEARLLDKAPAWMREVILFALNTGIRQDAIFALRWENVDFFRQNITIRAVTNKRHIPQILPMTGAVFTMLKRLFAERGGSSPWVFPNRKGGRRIGAGWFGKKWRKITSDAGIEDFHFHDLRHTFATRLIQGGTDLFTVSKLLGHKSITTTMRYLHHIVDQLRKGLAPLNVAPVLEFVDKSVDSGKKEGGAGG